MIYLMRHGQDDENYIGGWSDVNITPIGIKEVENTARWLKENLDIKKILSSDITRAKQTSFIVSNYLDVPLKHTMFLREQTKGDLNGMLKEIAIKEYPSYFDNPTPIDVYPNGESLKDLYNRIKELLPYIYDLEDETLIITHRGVINMIYYLLNNIELDMNKNRFDVSTASVHELNKSLNRIRRIK